MNKITFDTNLKSGFSNKIAPGLLPNPLPSPLKLNLGCGLDVRDDFINIDLFSEDNRIVQMDIRKLDLPDNSADLILASDVLEHFSHRETDAVLAEWARVLKPNATIIIRCPSLRLQTKAYTEKIWNAEVASYMIFGGQTSPGDFHCTAFDEISIKQHLERVGLKIVSFQEEDLPQTQGFINLNMVVKAVKILVSEQSDLFETKSLANDLLENLIESSNKTLAGKNEKTTKNNEKKTENLNILEEKLDTFNSTSVHPAINIVWEGSQFVYHSLALINREHCINLIKADVAEITIVPYEPDTFDAKIDSRFEKLQQNDVLHKAEVSDEISRLPYAWIRHQWPTNPNPPKGAKWIIMQPWEFSSISVAMAETFNQADEIWTPSNFSRQAFVNSGIDFNKIQIIPNGINPQIFTPGGDIFKLPTKKRLKFLFVGGTTYRKGFDVLLMAFVKAFKKNDDVCLVVKSTGTETYYKNQSMAEIIEKVQLKPDAPEIVHINNDDFSEAEMAAIYRACDVFVSSYRGEGFSLPTLEAMACGLPVIVTHGGATDDFTTDDFAWYINSTPKSVGNKIDGEPLVAETFVLEPNIQELVDTLQFLYNSPGNNFSMGLRASAAARIRWSWNRATLKLLTRLDYLYKTEMAPKAEKKLADIDDIYITLGKADELYIEDCFELSAELFVKILENSENLSDKIITHCFNRLAQISLAGDQLLAAKKYINAAISLAGETNSNPEISWLEATLLKADGKYIEALETITPAVNDWNNLKFNATLGINLEKYLLLMADIFVAMENFAEALQVYTVALKHNNYSAEACFGLGICYKKAGMQKESQEMFSWAEKYGK